MSVTKGTLLVEGSTRLVDARRKQTWGCQSLRVAPFRKLSRAGGKLERNMVAQGGRLGGRSRNCNINITILLS